MSAWILKIVLLGNALLLALPPGLCCLEPARRREVKPPPTACCQTRQEGSSEPASAPARDSQVEKCCCLREAVIPGQGDLTGLTPLDAAASFALPAFDPPRLVALSAGVDAYLLADPGPPLHVLKCVWRC
jgi:hypothetical protein